MGGSSGLGAMMLILNLGRVHAIGRAIIGEEPIQIFQSQIGPHFHSLRASRASEPTIVSHPKTLACQNVARLRAELSENGILRMPMLKKTINVIAHWRLVIPRVSTSGSISSILRP